MHYELRLLYCMNFLTSKTVKNDRNIFFRALEDVIVRLIWTSKQGKVSSLHIKEYGTANIWYFWLKKIFDYIYGQQQSFNDVGVFFTFCYDLILQ